MHCTSLIDLFWGLLTNLKRCSYLEKQAGGQWVYSQSGYIEYNFWCYGSLDIVSAKQYVALTKDSRQNYCPVLSPILGVKLSSMILKGKPVFIIKETVKVFSSSHTQVQGLMTAFWAAGLPDVARSLHLRARPRICHSWKLSRQKKKSSTISRA